MNIKPLIQKAERLQGRRAHIREQLREQKKEARDLKALKERLEEAQTVAQIVGQQTQEHLQYRISEIVTNALESVFPDPYEFQVIFEIKRGKTEARMVFSREGEEIDPLTAAGGGVVDVASFALRLSCYLIQRPRPAPVMVLDEPFRFVSKNYLPAVAELIEELSQQLGIQFIIVTHENELRTGNIIDLGETE